MGTIYYVACKDCKVTRNLDKFSYLRKNVKTRDEMLKYSDEVASNGGLVFRSVLLATFMNKHRSHDCVFFSDHDWAAEQLNPWYKDNEYEYDTNFWQE